MYEYFEHTADLGIRVRASNLVALFDDAARGLFAAIVDDLESVQERVQIDVEVDGSDREFLLFDWLRELLFRFDAEHLLFSRFWVNLRDDGLRAKAWGEPIDPARHVLAHEVKAITYHGLRVERVNDEWIAEFIVDI